MAPQHLRPVELRGQRQHLRHRRPRPQGLPQAPQGHIQPGYGTWDIYIANAAIIRADGSVLPIFTGQTASVGGRVAHI